MAKSLKPYPELQEASYIVNAYEFLRNYSRCPLFDEKITRWLGGGDAYWLVDRDHPSESYLDITINDVCNIYRLSQSDYYDKDHQEPFTILKFVNGKWIDETEKYQQEFNYVPNSWIKTISELPKGRYKFIARCRMDAEWFIEKINVDYKLYEANQKIYGMQNGIFSQNADNWNEFSNQEKIAQFKSTAYETASANDLKSIGRFRVLTYAETENTPEIKLKVVPKDQLVFPRGLTRIESYDSINQIALTKALSSNGFCKLLVTDDMKMYQTFDFDASEWKVVDHTDLMVVKSAGINAEMLADIDRAAWDKLLKGKSGIGFAYLMGIDAITDQCAIDLLTLQADIKGTWK